MTRPLHQIWLGPPMPPAQREWTERIRTASTAAGWSYRLWDMPALLSALPGDSVLRHLAARLDCEPESVTLATLTSDYARYALLAHTGGLYLDTDWELTTHTFPDFPTAPALYGQNEYYAPDPADPRPCNGILYLPPGAPLAPMESIRAAAAERILSHPDATPSHHFLPHVIGPRWLRTLRIPIIPLSPSLATHRQWHNQAPLIHRAAAAWLRQPMQNLHKFETP